MRGAWIDSLYILVACGVAFQIYLRLNSRRCHTPWQSNNILLKLRMLFPVYHFLYTGISMGESIGMTIPQLADLVFGHLFTLSCKDSHTKIC